MDEITITEGQAAPSHTEAIGGPATADAGTGGAARYAALGQEERDTLRQTLAAAHPDAIAELIDGGTVGEIIASLQTAKVAYHRTIEQARKSAPVSTGAPGRAAAVDVGRLSPLGKIAYGLKEQ